MKSRSLFAWLIAGLLLVAGVFFWARENIIVCWDGIEIDEPLLIELCGITEEEYLSDDFTTDDCPESIEAISMVGGCEPDWFSVWAMVAGFAIGYLVLSAIGYGIWRLAKPKKE